MEFRTSEEADVAMKFVELDLSNAAIISQLKLRAVVCETLCELAKEEFVAQQIVRENGIYLLGKHLLIRGLVSSGETQIESTPPDIIVTEVDRNEHTLLSEKPAVQLNAVQFLQIQVFRTFRRLAQLERHRRMLKSLLPATLLAELLGLNAFTADEVNYQHLIDWMSCLSEEDQSRLLSGVRACDLDQPPVHWIREYAVLELLGTGAFGQVYKARKETKSGQPQVYAIKEVNTTQAIFGRTEQERQQSVRNILNEVNIIKQQLRHPNIVRYYKTFLHGDRLYIVMEMLEGLPLTELINSMKEKNEHFTEDRIWHVFTQLVLALRYLHREKAIVHRDLSSNNIMIGEGDKATITDFGLAKQKLWDSSKMTSSVGTLVFSCPEIVQNQPYGEGADIWSLGCILYQMCTYTPPFQAECILTVASRIVGGQFEPLSSVSKLQYSEMMENVVRVCLTSDPQKRPDIIGVASHLTEILLKQLDSARQVATQAKLRLREIRDQFRLSSSTDAVTQRTTDTSRPRSMTSEVSLLHLNPSEKEITQHSLPRMSETQPRETPPVTIQRPSSSTRVAIPQHCLRPVNDPILDVVGLIRKLEYVSFQCSPSTRKHCAIKQFVDNYRRRLFSASIPSSTVKQELIQLARKVSKPVNQTFLSACPEAHGEGSNEGDNVTSNFMKALREASGQPLVGETDGGDQVTYRLVMTAIEILLRECGSFYEGQKTGQVEEHP
ncbi:Serine/threonine-protein kinase Nek10 [Clonorchis sinensis]|uniref:Serine/threonine-protein kinase Nek10 n=1 Tax=Clonorchis sinensis TaxID=79923 RepID=A0A8T1MXM4_CLOSI|nr:Serine/threonine-protein kinase Nek10 [Clonorchis sinensis]